MSLNENFLSDFLRTDSVKKRMTRRKLRNATTPAARKGSGRERSARYPPKTGPKMNPVAKHAPTYPIAFTRSATDVLSAMYALAEGSTAEENTPWKKRETKSRIGLAAIANTKKDADMPKSPMAMIGFLPNLSDRVPQKGERNNWAMAKEEARRPRARSDIWNCFAYRGRSGNTKEKATAFTNTAQYMKKSGDRI